MFKRLFAALSTLLLVAAIALVAAPVEVVEASPAEQYSGPYFGEGNFPPGCIRDMSRDNPDNICHHMRTDLNGLDSPQVDVLILAPVSPTVERDMRIMRQAVEMWEGGIDYLSGQMGLDWLSTGVDFHITVDAIDLSGEDGGEFTTYPVVDPEIVVIASNPAGGVGIGVDPVDFVFTDENLVPCHNVQNPFDFEYWDDLPGFNDHHGDRTGTYTEDCGGAGGNICFAINGAIDPAPEQIDVFNLFDLVAHEFGHCLTLGHVGDGAEGEWGVVPTNDIMAYSSDPAELNKCVSTLDVEVFATRMSNYLDTNGSGDVDGTDQLLVNDQIGEGGNPFQVQHPDDHLYASGTGEPTDCPQPDLGPVPGPRTDWTPDPVSATRAELAITGPGDGAVSEDGNFTVTGTVERVLIQDEEPTEPTGFYDDADNDASTPVTEILDFSVAVTTTHVDATIRLADLWPTTDLLSPTSYSLMVDGRKFDSFVRYAIDDNPRTWDNGAGAYMPAGTSTWDMTAKTVSFKIPRDYLAAAGITAPYDLVSQTAIGFLTTGVQDDRAPGGVQSVGVAAPASSVSMVGTHATVGLSTSAETVTFQHPDGNTFYPHQSTLGETSGTTLDPSHYYTLELTESSDVQFFMDWTDKVADAADTTVGTPFGPVTVSGSDLDLRVTFPGAEEPNTDGATAGKPESVELINVQGSLQISVEPYFVSDAVDGATYTLTAVVVGDSDGDGVPDSRDPCPNEHGTASGCPDNDGDGVADREDTCPDIAGEGNDGCPIQSTQEVNVYVGDVLLGSEPVDTANGPDSFSIPITVDPGTHELLVAWEDESGVLATQTLTVHHLQPDSDDDGVPDDEDVCPGHDDNVDTDGDGIPDGCDTGDPDPEPQPGPDDDDGDGIHNRDDNCPNAYNPGQEDMDGDGRGDTCDPDKDGDGHSNGKENSHGTDPEHPESFPTRANSTQLN